MTAVYVIGDSNTVLAFALGGVPGQVAQSALEARAAVEAVVATVRPAGGAAEHPTLLLVTHAAADWIRDDIQRLLLDTGAPLVLEIPGFGEPPGQSIVGRFVARLLGMRS